MRVELDCIAMRDADERALQWWRTDVLQQETELHCNDGGQICCNGRPSRVAMMADEYVTTGDRVALQWWQTRVLQWEQAALHCREDEKALQWKGACCTIVIMAVGDKKSLQRERVH